MIEGYRSLRTCLMKQRFSLPVFQGLSLKSRHPGSQAVTHTAQSGSSVQAAKQTNRLSLIKYKCFLLTVYFSKTPLWGTFSELRHDLPRLGWLTMVLPQTP